MTDWTAALEATALAQFLKASRWVYPLVNAGHVLGIALLLGAVIPMDLRLTGLRARHPLPLVADLLRPVAAAGLGLAVICGALLFATQAGDYVQNGWFRAKMALIALALVNIALHPRLMRLSVPRRRVAGAVSLCLWPAVLICGRMIAYS